MSVWWALLALPALWLLIRFWRVITYRNTHLYWRYKR